MVESVPAGSVAVPGHSSTKLTYADYLLFADDGLRHEIIGGEYFVTPSPVTRHQRISMNLSCTSPGSARTLYSRLDHELTYWRSRSQFEVDFVVGHTTGIEVKSKARVSHRAVGRHALGLVPCRPFTERTHEETPSTGALSVR